MNVVEIVFPAAPINATTRHRVEAQLAAAHMRWKRATAAYRAAEQDEREERQMYDMLVVLLRGTSITPTRKSCEHAAAARQAAEQALINSQRAYDMLSCVLTAEAGHVFGPAVLAERGSVLPRCRHCRALAGSFKASQRCAGDIHRCPRSVRPGESDSAATVHGRKDLLCTRPGAMSADFTSWTCTGHQPPGPASRAPLAAEASVSMSVRSWMDMQTTTFAATLASWGHAERV
jgi:hypothetical protein